MFRARDSAVTDEQAEELRLHEDARRDQNWKRWGPYLSERQWGTVREDYSENADCWTYFPHDHARSRVYRWGEDGLLGICDRQGRLCLAPALWNGKDPILKERLFGLGGREGNHGEDVKELYYYLDATPTASYLKALYKYPQAQYPYARLVEESRRRGALDAEFEISDTGVFDDKRYFDVLVEYAKAAPSDLLMRVTVSNRGPEAAPIWILPTIWFRNTWSWGRVGEGYWPRPEIARTGKTTLDLQHASLGSLRFELDPLGSPEVLFTDNETNVERLFAVPPRSRYVKDAFHEYLVNGKRDAVNPACTGTKAAGLYHFVIPPGQDVTLRLRLTQQGEGEIPGDGRATDFDATFAQRIREADAFYARRRPPEQTEEEARVARQAYAGLLWSKQFYHYVVEHWLEGDPAQPPPPAAHKSGPNRDWRHLYNRDVISMPDKWEYPWYAAWDVAFHMIPMARVDPQFAKEQMLLFLREWYLHPNGQMPAYEFALGDVNPPVHAWSAWRVYKMSGRRGHRDRQFLARVFQKLLLNFTWWVNRKDADGDHIFSGGFLGLDNIGLFDRSQPLTSGARLEQADGTAWMAFYASTMMAIALELAQEDRSYADMASKFFEHFVHIVDAMNSLGGTGLWDELDGFYYDQLHCHGQVIPLRTRSLVGITPLFAVEVLEDEAIANLPGFRRRTQWFLENRPDLAQHIAYMESSRHEHVRRLLAVPSRDRLVRMLRYLLDENEFLSPFGIRSLSRVHRDHPCVLRLDGTELRVDYAPGEATSGLFGGNSNWRGPVWLPLNFLIIEALERYHYFYGDSFTVEFPTGSGRHLPLDDVAHEIAARLARLFLPAPDGARPCHGSDRRYAEDAHFRDLVLFYEYFHGDNGRGAGAAHQTGWTALAAQCLEHVAEARVDARQGPFSVEPRASLGRAR
jgi:hypothetical protein